RPVELCDAEVLRRVRQRSLARLRQDVEPVPARTLGIFLPRWQHVAAAGARTELEGADGVLAVVDQLGGARLPASALEQLVLPARVRDYHPGMLDELTSTGDVLWAGAGELSGGDGMVTLLTAEAATELAPAPGDPDLGPLHTSVLETMRGGGARFFREILQAVTDAEDEPPATGALLEILWDLVWAGHLTNDTLAPLRARLGGGRPAHVPRRTAPRARSSLRRGVRAAAAAATAARVDLPSSVGRWSALPQPPPEVRTEAVVARTASLLDRHGVLVRESAGMGDLPGGFAAAYQVLRRLEDSGSVRRGYLVAGLGAAQFALPEVVDRLRADAADLAARLEDSADPRAHVLAATDPA
ncbi:DEAD/DEAH box helicase, partial [Georgenia sp. 10Sc9-8]|nr:DEAD/DEAH box helicase [Georgenia halotolerans]